MSKDNEDSEPRERPKSDFEKLYLELSPEERHEALRYVEKLQKAGLIVVEGDQVGHRRRFKMVQRPSVQVSLSK